LFRSRTVFIATRDIALKVVNEVLAGDAELVRSSAVDGAWLP